MRRPESSSTFRIEMFAVVPQAEALSGHLELRPVRPGETIELLHMLRSTSGGRASGCSDSGSSRPMPRYLDVSSEEQVAVVATMSAVSGVVRTVGVGVIRPLGSESAVAEVELFVVPAVRQQGVGSSLFAALVELAEQHGVRRLRFRVLAESTDLQTLLSRLSTVPSVWADGEQLVVEFPLAAGLAEFRRKLGETRDTRI